MKSPLPTKRNMNQEPEQPETPVTPLRKSFTLEEMIAYCHWWMRHQKNVERGTEAYNTRLGLLLTFTNDYFEYYEKEEED